MKMMSTTNKVGYALGDVANTLTFGLTSAFLLAYYTDVLGISAAAVGTLFLVARVWDAINDPIMGVICDKLFTKNQGEKFRPFLLKGSWPVVIASILVFWAPDGLSDTQKLIWAYVTYILWGMSYTFVNIPYGSLASVITNEPSERAALSGARALGGTIGSLASSLVMPLFLSFWADDLAKAYLYAVMLFGAISFTCYLLAYRMTQEHLKQEPSAQDSCFSLKDTVKTLSKNTPYLCVCGASVLMLTSMFCQSSVLYFYLAQNLAGALWIISFSAIAQIGSVVILAPIAGKLATKFGVKKLMLAGFGGTSITAIIAFLLPTSVYGTLFYYIFGMPFFMTCNVLIWANVADCIDYNYEISGKNQGCVIYASYSFMRKLGQAIAGFAAGIGLGLIGYNANLDFQADTTLFGIKILMFAVPAVLLAICYVLYYFLWNLKPKAKDPQIKADVTKPQTI